MVDCTLLRGFSPNSLTDGVLMHGLCRTRRIDEVKALFDKVPEPNIVLFNTLIDGYVKNDRLDEAKNIMNQSMLTIFCDPDVYVGDCRISHYPAVMHTHNTKKI